MVFRAFKGMIAAIKEGVAEAKAELASEKLADEALQKEQFDAIWSQPADETFAVALGAPHRWIFIGETAYDLCACEIAVDKKSKIAKLLIRDFAADNDLTVIGAVLTLETTHYATALLSRLAANTEDRTNKAEAAAAVAEVERLSELMLPEFRRLSPTGMSSSLNIVSCCTMDCPRTQRPDWLQSPPACLTLQWLRAALA
jgi:hypothetical protein